MTHWSGPIFLASGLDHRPRKRRENQEKHLISPVTFSLYSTSYTLLINNFTRLIQYFICCLNTSYTYSYNTMDLLHASLLPPQDAAQKEGEKTGEEGERETCRTRKLKTRHLSTGSSQTMRQTVGKILFVHRQSPRCRQKPIKFATRVGA